MKEMMVQTMIVLMLLMGYTLEELKDTSQDRYVTLCCESLSCIYQYPTNDISDFLK